MAYNWQLPEWPNFTYNLNKVQALIMDFAQETGEINGILQGLPKEVQLENLLQLMLSEAIKTSEIEGEYLSREDVMSSIRNNMGISESPLLIKDQQASGIGQLMVEVRKSFQESMSADLLKHWHYLLMKNARQVNAGEWRKGIAPMQIISGAFGKEIVHYEAPPSQWVDKEISEFIKWFNVTEFELSGSVMDAVLRASIAHLYFESIHPFEDGNGRIGRAIAEKALSYSLGRPVMLSLSKTIEKDRNLYYAELKKAQAGLEITDWLIYFATIVLEAQRDAKAMVQFTLKKNTLFDRYKSQLNDRQLKVINKMLESGTEGFEGGMTASKYMRIAQTSKATATRDLQQLTDVGILRQGGGGRSVRYEILL